MPAGLVKCYIAALPFLQQHAVAGDLFWGIVLFGGYWLAQNVRTAKRDDRRTIAATSPDPRCSRA